MKNLEELGISPTPWKKRVHGDNTSYVSLDGGKEVTVFAYNNGAINKKTPQNARMMAASPKMYEALRELYLLSLDPIGGTKEDREKQSKKYEEALDNARAALMEASGE